MKSGRRYKRIVAPGDLPEWLFRSLNGGGKSHKKLTRNLLRLLDKHNRRVGLERGNTKTA